MTTLAEVLAQAVGQHRAGELDAAEGLYRQILEAEPGAAAAWDLLGVLHYQRGRHELAVEHIRRAIALDAGSAAFHSHLANVLQAMRRNPEAAASYRRALELEPRDADALNNLGILCEALGQEDEAVACYRRALEVDPAYSTAHYNLGYVFERRRQWTEAADSYRRALTANPEFSEAHNNLGNVLSEQWRRDEALACYQRALAIQPAYAAALVNLGRALKQQGRHLDAIDCYRRALELEPALPTAHNNLGRVYQELGERSEALACYRRAIELDPNFAEAHNNLGNWREEQGQREEAAACYRLALERKPDFAGAQANLGNVLDELGQREEALVRYRRAVELDPESPQATSALVHAMQQVCAWEGINPMAERLTRWVDAGGVRLQAEPVSPFSFLTLPTLTTAAQQLRCAEQWVAGQLSAAGPPGVAATARRSPNRPDKLSIGYLSAEFNAHATATLIVETLEKHDHARFSIAAYSYGRDDGSPLRRRLIGAFDRFVELRDATHREAAERIAADEVDILVDLTGYTQEARTQILMLRPAPIQVNFLGYPGTLGTAAIDYILVDEFVVPSDQQPYYAERLVHLPTCYQPNDSQRPIAEVTPSRARCGLPESGFVFCSFNNHYKITAEMFEVWMRLLRAVSGSVLWLLNGDPLAVANLQREAEARGVAPERLVFAPRRDTPEHLARHRLADLFLDTLPYNAHTTASDALWAGLPVVSLAGGTFASRVAGSLLGAVGLSELVTHSRAEYEALALQLAHDRGLLAELTLRLRANRAASGLFDAARFARNLERAYAQMWELHARGEKPRAFRVEPV